jgi:hypothetical protein
MSREFIIEFRENGELLSLEVEAKSSAAADKFKKKVSRQRLELPQADLDQLRTGAPQAGVVNTVATAITEWLMDDDLDLPVLLRLNTNPQPPWRLVFSSENLTDEGMRQRLAELPIELLEPPGFALPLALLGGVSSIVHRLPKTGPAPPSSTARNWPFRVLVVRSNPADLGGAVPKAGPIRDVIMQALPGAAAGNLIHVDVLSSEGPGFTGRPTSDQLSEQVLHSYDMLVYLGHGDLQPSPTGGPPLGVLLLETEDGESAKRVDARQLSGLLHKNPIPVVLLVGCLTAAETIPEQFRADVAKSVPGWIRGSQGVAQALVNGASGVHFVVGMRFKVEDKDATRFLKKFFSVLLSGPNPGDLEAALGQARNDLHFNGAHPSWAAPVAFRTGGDEPTFAYLATEPPALTILPSLKEEKTRAELWQMLSQINMQLRGNGLHGTPTKFLDALEQEYFDSLAAQGSLLIPERREIDPTTLVQDQETPVEIILRLRKSFAIKSMDGVVTVSGGGKLVRVEATPELDASGLECFPQNPRDNRIKFHLQNAQPVPLPEGPLLKITLAIPASSPAVYLVGLDAVQTEPATAFCCLSNAVIVPAP